MYESSAYLLYGIYCFMIFYDMRKGNLYSRELLAWRRLYFPSYDSLPESTYVNYL